jgi:hypothetical protein
LELIAMKLKFTFVVQNDKAEPVAGLFLVLHPPGQPRRRLATGTSNDKGYVRVQFEAPDQAKQLVASIFNPTSRKLLHRSAPRAIDQISDWWAEQIIRRPENEREPDEMLDIERPERPEPPSRPAPGDTEVPVRAVASAGEMAASRIAMASTIREGFRKAAQPELQRRLRNRKRGGEVAKRFLGNKPKGALAASSSFVPAGENPTTMIERTREAGVRRLEDKALSQRGWTLSADRVKELGLRDGMTIPPNKLQELLRDTQSRQGAQTSDFEAILKECAAKHEVEAAMKEDQAAKSAADTDVVADVVDTATDSSLSLQDRIAAVLDSDIPLTGTRPTAADLSANLTLSLPSGPADVDAYYDFHSLQVAWLDAWTALIDKTTAAKVKALYESIVDVVDPKDIPGGEADFSEIDELYDLLDSLEDSIIAAQTTLSDVTSSAPEWIAAWCPEIADYWSWLTDSEREYVRAQWEIEEFLGVIPHQLGYSSFKNSPLNAWGSFPGYPDGWVPKITIGDAVDELETLSPKKYHDRALACGSTMGKVTAPMRPRVWGGRKGFWGS